MLLNDYARQIEYKKDLRINRREWWHNRFFCKSIRNIFQSSFVLIFVQIKGISPLSPWLKKNQLIVFVGKRFDVRLSLLKKFGKHSTQCTAPNVLDFDPKNRPKWHQSMVLYSYGRDQNISWPLLVSLKTYDGLKVSKMTILLQWLLKYTKWSIKQV